MVLGDLLERLTSVVEEEIRQLSAKGFKLDPELYAMKLRLLAQMQHYWPAAPAEAEEARARLLRLREALATNSRKLSQHCECVREIWDGIAIRARADESDGTYSTRDFAKRSAT